MWGQAGRIVRSKGATTHLCRSLRRASSTVGDASPAEKLVAKLQTGETRTDQVSAAVVVWQAQLSSSDIPCIRVCRGRACAE